MTVIQHQVRDAVQPWARSYAITTETSATVRWPETAEGRLAMTIHDLRAPLTIMRGYAQLIARAPSLSDAVITSYASRIEEETRRMDILLQQVLESVSVDGEVPLRLERLDLVSLTSDLAERFRCACNRRIHFTSAHSRLILHGDDGQLRRALGNIIENALKYSAPNSPVLIDLRVISESGRAQARISVTDEGVGIPKAELAQVFLRGYRGSNVRGTHAGTGLGLAGVRAVMEQHGGGVSISSRLGKGTTVTLGLPAELREASSSSAEYVPPDPRSRSTLPILLAE